ncbi:MAG: multicopper oxidase domain-containing protein, partial [Syntrophomonas sp.]|nr:multicopper oxidase domain-containing protein [Syntrophomonas sp.]
MARGSRLLTIIIALLVLMTALGTHIIYTIYKGSQGLNLTGGLNRNELQIPVELEDTNPDPDTAEYVLTVQTGQTSFVNGLTTATLGYNGDYLGPLLRFRQGEKVNIRVENNLDFATTIHWHGLVVDGDHDGGPHQGIQPGDSWNPSFTVDQPAATLWYHPHLMGKTANQVYYGLAGLIYIDDQSSAELGIP